MAFQLRSSVASVSHQLCTLPRDCLVLALGSSQPNCCDSSMLVISEPPRDASPWWTALKEATAACKSCPCLSPFKIRRKRGGEEMAVASSELSGVAGPWAGPCSWAIPLLARSCMRCGEQGPSLSSSWGGLRIVWGWKVLIICSLGCSDPKTCCKRGPNLPSEQLSYSHGGHWESDWTPSTDLHVGCQVFCKIKCIPPRLVSWELSRAHRIRNCIAFTLCKSHCGRPFGPWLAGKRNQLEACCSPCPNINWKKK